MPNYRRTWYPGGTYFFTVNLLERRSDDFLVCYIDTLRGVVNKVKKIHPFKIHAWMVDWPYSTFHRLVEQGVYPQDCGRRGDEALPGCRD